MPQTSLKQFQFGEHVVASTIVRELGGQLAYMLRYEARRNSTVGRRSASRVHERASLDAAAAAARRDAGAAS